MAIPAIRTGLAAIGLVLIAPAAALADDIQGKWTYETDKFDDNCKITGDVSFTPTTKDAYACRFTSTQTCLGSTPATDKPPVSVTMAQQSCTATLTKDKLDITSQVERIAKRTVDGKPATEDWGYYADNFSLTLTKSGQEMTGDQHDEVRKLAVRFWRDQGAKQ